MHWNYLKSVMRHKWFVFLACFRFNVPIWIAILHDWDKFLPDEWLPYARYFYGRKNAARRDKETGTYTRIEGEDLFFDFAWLLHQKRNKHHWQWWILPKDDGSVQVFEMSDLYRREMLADWVGAGRAYNPDWTLLSPSEWYEKNKDLMILHPNTRKQVENALEKMREEYRSDQKRIALGL